MLKYRPNNHAIKFSEKTADGIKSKISLGDAFVFPMKKYDLRVKLS